MIKYLILTEKHTWDLEKKVENYLNKGWQLVGGVSYFEATDRYNMYMQAIMHPNYSWFECDGPGSPDFKP